jgi:hypothetical protein
MVVSSSTDRHGLDYDRAAVGLCARSDVTWGCGTGALLARAGGPIKRPQDS